MCNEMCNSIPRKDKIQICRIYIIWAFIVAFTLKQISRRQREAGNSFGSLLLYSRKAPNLTV